MNFAVVGDIHANIFALEACLNSLEKYQNDKKLKLDKIFFIGDLLTYGTNVNSTLEKLISFERKNNVDFILGNHDEMYYQLIFGKESNYFNKLPDWIKFSVDLTLKEIDINLFKSIKMKKFCVIGQTLICHANCLILDSSKNNIWTYVDSLESYIKEAKRLEKLNFKLGVYGHTHRRKIFYKKNNNQILFNEKPDFNKYSFDLSDSSLLIINSGSIGQPRSLNDLQSSWLHVKVENSSSFYQSSYIKFDYNFDDYINSIKNKYKSKLDFSKKITSFFLKYN